MRKLNNNTLGFFRLHRKLGWFCLLAVIAAIGVTLWSREEGEPRPPTIPKPIAFSVSFQGYSNSPSGQRWAILTVTNRDFGNLGFSGPFGVELSARLKDEQATRWMTPGFIPPHSCGRIAVEIPPAPGAWRARCRIIRSTWRDKVRNACPGWFPELLLPRPTHTMDDLVTDWVRE